jgi:hypothetical protein
MAGKQTNPGSPLKNERGQSIVLVAIMILSFLMFFTFTLNTGLLIHAKISVQSAADAAAYAGAATQGRYLNSISFLNYDMRRQYKKFLFRNIFIGALGSPDFPGTGTGKYDFPKWDFSSSPQGVKKSLLVPIVCVPLMSRGVNSDRCGQINMRNGAKDIKDKLGVLPGGGSAIIQSLINATESISNTIEKTCVGQSGINKAILISWLFKGEDSPDFAKTMIEKWFALDPASSASNPNKGQITDLVGGMVEGLGLYPRNILNLMRIQTLVGFLNTPSKQDLDLETVENLERNQNEAETRERTILAFKSALSNLNKTIFDPSKVLMDELMPPAPLLTVDPVLVNGVQVFYQDSAKTGGVGAGSSTYCQNYAQQINLDGIPVGVKRVVQGPKNILYAVKVRAFIKPRGLLFAPWSDELELTAIAGAKPFGSRIGPAALSADKFVTKRTGFTNLEIGGERVCDTGSVTPDECPIPDLDVGSGKTFLDVEFLAAMKAMAMTGSNFSLDGIKKAIYHATAPNPPEIGGYSILPPPPTDDPKKMLYEFIPFFDGKGTTPGTTLKFPIPSYRFYAPVFPKSTPDVDTTLKKFLSFIINLKVGVKNYGLDPQTTYDSTFSTLKGYITNSLNNGTLTENGETSSFAAIQLPMYNLQAPTKPFWVNQRKNVLTSWAPSYIRKGPSSFNLAGEPGFGYSVKHVAISTLLTEGLPNATTDELDDIPH